VLAGQADQVLQFGLGLDVEVGNAGVEGLDDFGVGLAGTGVDDFGRVSAGLGGAVQFAAADDVEAGAGLGQVAEDVDVAAGLDGVADQGLEVGVGALDLGQMVQEGGLTVDVGGCADGLGDGLDGDVFGEQFALSVFECIHC